MPSPRALPEAVHVAAGPDAVHDGDEDRVRHAAGRSYPDLIRLRAGELEEAPDAVLVPADAAAVGRVLDACAEVGVGVVPFGGGTSVVGGVAAIRDGLEAVVALDLGRLRGIEVDRRSLVARLGPGLRGPEAESGLAREGMTLGHFPQSFPYATIGGFAATRSVGRLWVRIVVWAIASGTNSRSRITSSYSAPATTSTILPATAKAALL